MLYAQQILQPPTKATTHSYFFNPKKKKKLQIFFFSHLVKLGEYIQKKKTSYIFLFEKYQNLLRIINY